MKIRFDLRKYIEEIEEDIEELIESECEGTTPEGEELLHFYFENCKHAKELMAEKQAMHADHEDGRRMMAARA